MTRHAGWVAAARAANALFFLVTATYCILTYNSFAYQQFIRPRLVASLAGFVAFHHLWHWVLLGLIVATLIPEWKTARGRRVSWAYVAAMAVVGLALLYRPLLPAVENDAAGLWLAVIFLLPPLGLALYDHLATADSVRLRSAHTGQVVLAAALAGVWIWACNTAATPLHRDDLGDYTLTSAATVFSAAVSLAVHVGLFTTAGLALATVLQLAGERSPRRQYWLLGGVLITSLTVVVHALVFVPLSFDGTMSWVIACEVAALLAGTWSAIARRMAADRADVPTAVELWTGPIGRTGGALGLACVPVAQYLALRRAETFDWNFLVQNLCVLTAWLATLLLMHGLVGRAARRAPGRPVVLTGLAIVAVAGVGAGGTIETTLPGSGRFVPAFVLDAYATVEPSYRLIRQALTSETSASRAFYARLSAQTLIEHVDVSPVTIEFARPLTPAAAPPHVFLFVIDSLRRDYLSPYNPAVTFTPAIEAFARESVTFTRAFTAYGGTGLSMPAIWAGSMLLHKEYVQPFQPMNALEKLLTANRYHAVMSLDHITEQIVSPSLTADQLDAGRDEMQFDFCSTLQELQGRLEGGLATGGPVFAHTRALNLHISKLTTRIAAPDASLGQFQRPAAAAIQRMDRCFGAFIAYLQHSRLYDDSIVILTADHGDALGESRRWGHAYTLFPEIVRIPLLVHVPPRLRDRLVADPDAPSFSTDITPSLYALLGYRDTAPAWPQGRPLFVPAGTDLSWRRTAPALLASSYGPVYGVLRNNGELLYIADGVNRRDYAYDLRGLKPVRVGVTADMRRDGRAFIDQRLERLASLYHFAPGS